jgi:hypothetical protein
MRILILLAFASFLLFSCKKESGTPDTNIVVPPPPPPPPPPPADTSALGKFVKAAGITDEILKVSLDSLITRAKSHGWWDLCMAIYPIAGGTSSSTSFNLKDTAAYQLAWSGSPTFSSAGASFGDGVSYGNTGINDNVLTYNNAHISFYSNTNDSTIDQWVMGVDDATVPYNELSLTNAGFKQAVAYFFTNNGSFSAEQSNTIGWYLVSSGSTDVRIYKDGTDITTTTEAPVDIHANNTFLIGTSRNLAGTNTQCAFSTIGFNIDSTTAALMSADIRDFVNEK